MTQLKNQKNEKQMKKTLSITLSLIFVMLFLVPYQTFGWVFLNESCSAFSPDGCSNGVGTQGIDLFYSFSIGQNLSQLIAEGAGYVASSQSDYLDFINKIEMSDLNGIDYQGLRESLLLSFENLEKAIVTYSNIIATADTMSYSPDIIKKLESFDYLTFQNKKCLNSVIFGGVIDYLKKCDVRGVYKTIYKEMESISTQLTVLKTMIDQDQFPEITTVWQVNQKYAELMLFGQYIAEVFYEIN